MKVRRGRWLLLLAALACSGTVGAASDQLRIDLRTSSGQLIPDAECIGANQDGVQKFRSGRVEPIRASSSELLLVCTSAEHGSAVGALRAIAGSAYPTWIEMVFGEVSMFDAPLRASGTAVKGTTPGQFRPPRGVAANPTSHACMQRLPGAICE